MRPIYPIHPATDSPAHAGPEPGALVLPGPVIAPGRVRRSAAAGRSSGRSGNQKAPERANPAQGPSYICAADRTRAPDLPVLAGRAAHTSRGSGPGQTVDTVGGVWSREAVSPREAAVRLGVTPE
ncbi:hypothetical protein GCM10017600_08690 [Streptosporangium carneum]|uniref:Uncharacterized protein n=1 Tax=Streptosporangium carneum TaxID=47481 RepID=A0A9W6MAM5_9ACTN|nr:hypothetical protein GCM10017600_08690 [Streptosporangium carneum]